MKDPKGPSSKVGDLRRRAEARLQAEAVVPEELSPAETTRLIHELRVHQIELEMQNEALRQAQVLLEESRSQYADLYDFAPVSYLTLDERGKIVEANLTAASLLGVERSRLLGQFFPLFLVESDRRDFRQLLNHTGNQREFRGEFNLQDGNGGVHTMLLDILFLQDGKGRQRRRLTITDITDLKQAQGALEESRQQQRQLTKRLLTAQELERQRIARDLHDDLGQSLMALKMELNAVKRKLKRGEPAWDEFDQAIVSVNGIADQARGISRALMPSVIENLGLRKALAQLLTDFRKYHQVPISQDLDEVSGLFSAEAQVMLYRIVQECLTNVAKHGKATRVGVQVKKAGEAVCIICEDDGIGFDPAAVRSRDGNELGLGLATMKERVRLLQGSFELTSAKGKGTRIAITLPPDKNPR